MKWPLALGALVLPDVAFAANYQVFLQGSVVVTLGKKPGIGLGAEVSPMVAVGDSLPALAAGPFVQARVVTSHGWTVVFGGRAGPTLPAFNSGVGYVPLFEVDALLGYQLGSDGPGVVLGASVASLFGGLDVTTVHHPKAGRFVDPTIALGLRYPLVPAWIDGRPVRDRGGKVVLPEVVFDSADAEARAWLQRARTEHSSVLEFDRIARSLAALGAPIALVGRTLSAMVDERRHATLCYAQAARLGRRPIGVGRMRRHPISRRHRDDQLAALGTSSILDGILGEGDAAARADLRASSASDLHTHRIESTIAREEAGHARLAEDLVRWCRTEGSRRVRRALAQTEG